MVALGNPLSDGIKHLPLSNMSPQHRSRSCYDCQYCTSFDSHIPWHVTVSRAITQSQQRDLEKSRYVPQLMGLHSSGTCAAVSHISCSRASTLAISAEKARSCCRRGFQRSGCNSTTASASHENSFKTASHATCKGPNRYLRFLLR